MKSTQMQLYRGGELVLHSRDGASDFSGEDHVIERVRPHVVRLRGVHRRGERRHNYVRRWRFRGVDELRRQQADECPPPDINAINETC